MSDTAFTSMIVNGLNTTIDAAACASCAGVPRACVKNASGTAFGYYQALLPQ
jgi:hypothetical protein